jgi:1-acyl-sn-glycerol-3-phosphate acyltransferase
MHSQRGAARRARVAAADRTYLLPPADQPLGPVAAVWLRRLRALDTTVLIIAWTLLSMVIQGVLLVVPGRGKVLFPKLYWGVFSSLLGMQIRVLGTPATRAALHRPIVFVANHSSWLDVAVIGAKLETCFVSKDAVQDWPGVNLVARLGRTAYVTRQRAKTGQESDVLRRRLDQGDNILLFPEGTTDDGARVLPFRSSFLSVTEGEAPPIVQPISIAYDRLAGLPTGWANRPLFAYYGEMNIGTHFFRLVRCHGFRATLLLHKPVDPRDYADRKALTRALQDTIANGAATLRQNRPIG